jgi:MATE family multidrug resistance protein
MGIAGAGWATVAGTSASALVGLLLLARARFIRDYRNVIGWGLDWSLLRRLISFGLPQGMGALFETLGFTAFMVVIGWLGTVDLAATSIAFTLNLLCFLPMLGVGQAVEVLVGQRLGEDRPVLASASVWSGLIVAVGFTVVVGVAYVLVPHTLVLPFRTQHDPAGWAQVESRVVVLLQFVAVYCLLDSVNVVFAFALRGAGDTRFVMWLAVLVCWPVMVVPAAAAWYFGWGLYVAWSFASLYVFVLSALYLARFRQGKWQQMRVIEQPEGDSASQASEQSAVAAGVRVCS